jgi:predicted AlkP superfamily phosphohydrolase/phosphomutase
MSRLFVLGIDGLPPSVFRRFAREGLLPNCVRLRDSSAAFDVVPTLPPLTAPGWLTIASGADPSTLGVRSILQPSPGASPDTVLNGFDRTLSHAEYLWETLSRSELPAIVLKYPGSWPPRTGGFVQVDGGGGYADITCPFEALPSAAYVTEDPAAPAATPASAHEPVAEAVPGGYAEHWRIDSGGAGGRLTASAREPLGWEEMPPGLRPAFETVLHLEPSGRGRRDALHALACESDDGPVLVVSPAKSWSARVGALRVGEWSGWITRGSEGEEHALRLKLLRLDPRRCAMHLYRSEGHRTSGFTVPAAVARDLLSSVGPVVEWTGTFDLMNGLIDLDTQLELYAAHTTWLQGAIEHLGRGPWHGFFTHWHVVEYAHHIGGAALDDAHGLTERERARHLDFLRETYRLLDALVGTALEAADDAAVALVSDHGHDLVHTLFHVNDLLREHGLLELHDDHSVDWSRTCAYGLFPGLILLSREDRWPGGIVSSRDAEEVLREISDLLRSVRDPRRGHNVVTAVLDRDAMQAFGQGGDGAPDLFFTLDRGYEVATRVSGAGWLVPTTPGRQLTSGHGSFHPLSASARTLALIRHPSLRAGSTGRGPVSLRDLAPTFAALMGIEPPRDADGQAIDLDALGVAALEVGHAI